MQMPWDLQRSIRYTELMKHARFLSHLVSASVKYVYCSMRHFCKTKNCKEPLEMSEREEVSLVVFSSDARVKDMTLKSERSCAGQNCFRPCTWEDWGSECGDPGSSPGRANTFRAGEIGNPL